ncbi:MAG: DUF1800 domain-containing protein [Methylococcaceae bacterium]
MQSLSLPQTVQATTVYRQLQQDKKAVESDEQRKAQAKAIAQARQVLAVGFMQEFSLQAVNGNAHTEGLVWFWFNHFNVFWRKGLVGAALPDYVNTAIRPFIQGRFRDLLMATLTHPAMIVYLDNVRNFAGHINENYARELLELHTLGVDSGYTQTDVKEVARVLTGVGLRPLNNPKIAPRFLPLVKEKGEFRFSPQKHDFGIKHVLGQDIQGQGFAEIELLVDRLSKHPATAKHIATQLSVFLLGDSPPVDTIAKASKVFIDSEGDLAKTTATILANPLPANAPRSFKDPYRYVLSAVRLLSTGMPLTQTRPLVRWLNALGEPLFSCHTPNGYSLYGHDWLNAGQLTQRFELAREMVNTVPYLTTEKVFADKVLAQASTQQLISSLSSTSREALAKAGDAKERLALLLASPEFMYW